MWAGVQVHYVISLIPHYCHTGLVKCLCLVFILHSMTNVPPDSNTTKISLIFMGLKYWYFEAEMLVFSVPPPHLLTYLLIKYKPGQPLVIIGLPLLPFCQCSWD